jgi:hypothetical protein
MVVLVLMLNRLSLVLLEQWFNYCAFLPLIGLLGQELLLALFQLFRLLLSFSPAHQSWWAEIRTKNMINIIWGIIVLAVFFWAVRMVFYSVIIIGHALFNLVVWIYNFIKNKLK